MQHCNTVTSTLCRKVQCGYKTLLWRSMNGPFFDSTRPNEENSYSRNLCLSIRLYSIHQIRPTLIFVYLEHNFKICLSMLRNNECNNHKHWLISQSVLLVQVNFKNIKLLRKRHDRCILQSEMTNMTLILWWNFLTTACS